jgi:hypothetical protein
MNKGYYLEKAIEISKEYARGGAGNGGYDGPAEVLEKVYEKLIKLAKEIEE